VNIVLIIPTGVGAEIGGHAGDGNPVAKLMASTCDNLITHPNVVNASDINEMTENTLYVEGSMLDRFLEGDIQLKKVYRNKILLVVNEVTTDVINSVSAARATIGADIDILKLNVPLEMKGEIHSKFGAIGSVTGHENLIVQLNSLQKHYEFDALAISTPIKVAKDVVTFYLENGGPNPWGGIEARVSKFIAEAIDKPVAHSPMDDKDSEVYKVLSNLEKPVEPRMSAELVSVSYLHCILKGLHKAPRSVPVGTVGLSRNDVDFLISPVGIWGRPHKACYEAGIPIIMVKENTTCMYENPPADVLRLESYLEVAGYIQAIKSGVSLESIRRPLRKTNIINGG